MNEQHHTVRFSKVYSRLLEDEFKSFTREGHFWMLAEDLRNGVFPYDHSARKQLVFALTPTHKYFEDQLSEAFGGSHGRLSDAVYSMADSIVADIVVYGRSISELVTFNEKPPYRFEIERLSHYNMEVSSRQIIQRIPPKAQREMQLPSSIRIPKDKCFVVGFPLELGGEARYLTLKRELSFPSRHTSMEMALERMKGNMPEYDYDNHTRMIEAREWRLTKYIGWDHRQSFSGRSKYHTDYMINERKLLFKRSKIILRDIAILEVKRLIEWISSKVGVDVKVTIENRLQSLDYINEGIAKWRAGSMNYTGLSQYLYDH